jgi:hypothetical protein
MTAQTGPKLEQYRKVLRFVRRRVGSAEDAEDSPLREGTLLVGGLLSSSFTVRDGIFIAISQESQHADPVAVANALQPLTGVH